jgi:hypothetical protein
MEFSHCNTYTPKYFEQIIINLITYNWNVYEYISNFKQPCIKILINN